MYVPVELSCVGICMYGYTYVGRVIFVSSWNVGDDAGVFGTKMEGLG